MKDISIEEQLKDKGIRNSLLIEAFSDIPEAFFLSENLHPYFYEDVRIEKAIEKTEPRVIVIARMLEQLDIKEEEKILITGVDSVYILAVLSKIYKEVLWIINKNYEINLAQLNRSLIQKLMKLQFVLSKNSHLWINLLMSKNSKKIKRKEKS